MGFLEQLDESLNLPNVYYHKFITSYKERTTDVYVFCEGSVDLSYYCEQIERINPDVVIHKCVAECKNNVLQIWKYIDWNYYQKNRVLFFVDRDLSYWVNEPQEFDANVYVTDGYSFENDAVTPDMFTKLLEDLYGFANYSSDEKEQILSLYSEKWMSFLKGSYDLMACILYRYQFANDHTAHNLNVQKCLDVGEENIWKTTIRGLSFEDYYREKLKVDDDSNKELRSYKERFIAENTHYSIRGKWCLEFMICLMDYVLENAEKYAPSLYMGDQRRPKRIVELTSKGAMATIAPKMKPADSLVAFLCANIGIASC